MKICISNVASYRQEESLDTDEKINLIYGLNGSGKTTISNFLKNIENESFTNCHLERFDSSTQKILVYNQEYIRDVFDERNVQKGIFTLSKENKDADKAIKKASDRKMELDNEKETLKEKILENTIKIAENLKDAQDVCFKIKADYTGGDRILDDAKFLEGLKGSKAKHFNHILGVEKSQHKPEKEVEDIKEEVKELTQDNTSDIQQLTRIDNNFQNIENNSIMQEVIIGNENNVFAEIISQLNNSDWVKTGLKYVDENSKECPFCQQEINNDIVQNITDYFDRNFEGKILELKQLQKQYQEQKNKIIGIAKYREHHFFAKNNFSSYYVDLRDLLDSNLTAIANKINSPSKKITLKKSSSAIEKVNNCINTINKSVGEHNNKLKNKQIELDKLKEWFWINMRYEYDRYIVRYEKEEKKLKVDESTYKKRSDEIDVELEKLDMEISKQQKKTINIEGAIDNINNNLNELGLTGFSIKKHEDNYRIGREGEDGNIFRTLSEGEKNIISFLYFMETCKGKESASDTKEKIIVIDDPISSLSQMFVFNVAQFINQEIFPVSKQCFVLTHGLYFFHELTRIAEKPKLFRVHKKDYSIISKMGKNEIKTDYDEYWHVIRNAQDNETLLANCMRNIIEYFFGFIDRNTLNEVFSHEEFKDNKYSAFKRYVNRESHSDLHNTIDFKEFDYEIFKDTFRQVFEISGYIGHYNKMMNM